MFNHSLIIAQQPDNPSYESWVDLVQIVGDNFSFILIVVFFSFWVFIHHVRSITTRRQTERSRREIAAYIAEGSMSAEQGERLMRAESRSKSCDS